LIILHFSQIGFTDDRTFMVNPPFKKVVLLKRPFHIIPRNFNNCKY